LAGASEILFNPGGVTDIVVDPTTLPDVAVIVVLPKPTAVLRPVALIVETLILVDAHVTVRVMS